MPFQCHLSISGSCTEQVESILIPQGGGKEVLGSLGYGSWGGSSLSPCSPLPSPFPHPFHPRPDPPAEQLQMVQGYTLFRNAGGKKVQEGAAPLLPPSLNPGSAGLAASLTAPCKDRCGS